MVTSEQFMELFSMLLGSLAEDLQQQMLELLMPLSKLPPDYATFKAATKSCLLLEELASYQPDRQQWVGMLWTHGYADAQVSIVSAAMCS
jgi:hypothetical protein